MEVQLQATTVALELLAWDKARTEGKIPAEEAERVDSHVHLGALQYQRLLGTIHGERETAPMDAAATWVEESQSLRRDREHMTEKTWIRKGMPLRLTDEEIDQLDRKHPERSFSGRARTEGGDAPERTEAGPAPEADTAGQLERLVALHREGALSDEEFAAAKRRVLG